MTYKQIEAARETRMWIGQVIVPAVALGITVVANPHVRDFVAEKKRGFEEKKLRKNLKLWKADEAQQ